MSLKVSDPVIVYKPIWVDEKPKIGNISTIFIVNDKVVYGVKFEEEEDSCSFGNRGCNIFKHHDETIELDLTRLRSNKLKQLGI